ncbi:amino acid permease-domain-containing protein [Sphaerosporella brunnea]|uniref:Amino acid permease-domain-containing protein n=1 Tax=Sphaerosporella brunnea TaxID=1250544 RepID=A0A5J5EPP9_9PEZI|nr:amino acid permease-domain-containing protein [Sphaerosporella brunnea]
MPTAQQQQQQQAQHSEDLGLALDAEDQALLNEAKANPDALVTATPDNQKLKTFSVVCIIVNRMIGSGIFSTAGTVVRGTDSVPIALVLWIVGALVTVMGLCVYLELGLSIPKYKLRGSDKMVSVPRSGGEKNYLEYIYKRPRYLATCVFAVVFICIGNTAGNAISFAQNFLQMCNVPEPADWVTRGVAIAVVSLCCLLHGSWRAGGIYVNNALALLKIAVLLVIVGAGFAAYAGTFPEVNKTGNGWRKENTPRVNGNAYGYASALLGVMFSYGGAINANYVLSEVHKPQKTLKKGAFTAVAIVSALYILTTIAYFGAVTLDEMRAADDTTFVAMTFFNKIFGGTIAATRVLPGLVAVSSLGNIIVVTFVAARVKAEIAKEGILPFSKFFAANTPTLFTRLFRSRSAVVDDFHDRTEASTEQTPAGALLLHWIFSMIIVIAPPVGDAYTFFIHLYSYTIDTCLGALLAAGLLWLRWKPHSTWVAESNFKPWGGPTMAMLYLLFNSFIIVAPFIPPTSTLNLMASIKYYIFPTVGLGLLVAGGFYWLGFRFVWPRIYKRELRQTRIPILVNGVQVHEIVICSWVVPGEVEDGAIGADYAPRPKQEYEWTPR